MSLFLEHVTRANREHRGPENFLFWPKIPCNDVIKWPGNNPSHPISQSPNAKSPNVQVNQYPSHPMSNSPNVQLTQCATHPMCKSPKNLKKKSDFVYPWFWPSGVLEKCLHKPLMALMSSTARWPREILTSPARGNPSRQAPT